MRVVVGDVKTIRAQIMRCREMGLGFRTDSRTYITIIY